MKDKRASTLLLISALLILTAPSILCAATITLSWQPNTEPDLQGYYIHFGTQPRSYGPPIYVNLVTTYTLEDLEENIPYYFALSAVDTNGNESGLSEEISRTLSLPDTLSPTISITSPILNTDGVFETDRPVIQVSGTAQDDHEITQVSWLTGNTNGVAEGTANWSIPQVTLNEGLNTVVVTAADAAGNTGSATLTVRYAAPDTTPPAVVITSPVEEESYTSANSIITLSGTASDDHGLQQVSWESTTGERGTASGTGNWTIDAIELVEGLNTITVLATDRDGNTSTDTLAVTCIAPDTLPPTISITNPAVPTGGTLETDSAVLQISGTAQDDHEISQVTWSTGSFNGVATGTVNWSIADIALADGRNIVTITATDPAGNSSSDNLTVVYSATDTDTAAPTVTIKTPTEKKRYLARTSTVRIGGAASDNIGIAKIEWRNSRGEQGTCSGTDNWQTPGIRLNRWWNTITITAFDEAGNIDHQQLRIFRWK